MWESKTTMLTLLKRLFLCFAECNVKYLKQTSSKSWSTYPTSHSQAHPCSLWSHKSFSSSNNSPSEKPSALLSPEKATALGLRTELEHHVEGSKAWALTKCRSPWHSDVLKEKTSPSLVLERKDIQVPLVEDLRLWIPEDRKKLLGILDSGA